MLHFSMGSSILGQVYTKKNSHVYPLQALIYDFEVNFAIKKIKICISNSDGLFRDHNP